MTAELRTYIIVSGLTIHVYPNAATKASGGNVDRLVTMRFFRVLGGKRQKEAFADRLESIEQIDKTKRVRTLSDEPYWIDKITISGKHISGRFCRRQSKNLPPQAPPEGGLKKLAVGSIGPNVAWRYHSEYAVIGIEAGRSGLPLNRFMTYVKNICDCTGYGFLPVTTDVNLERLRTGRVRELSIRVATPTNLETATPDQQAVQRGMSDLMAPGLSTTVEVRYASRIGGSDLRIRPVERIVRWLRREKSANRGGISMIRAKIIEADGDSIPLDLLDEVHLSVKRELDLPDDDPDLSYEVRRSFIRSAFEENDETLRRQFGGS